MGGADVIVRGVLPYLRYKDVPAAAAWLERVPGFRETSRWLDESGSVTDLEIMAGDTAIWLSGRGAGDGSEHDRQASWIGVWVDDVDAMHARVSAAGVEAPAPEDQFYGVRSFSVQDPEGRSWGFVQRIPVKGRDGLRYVEKGAVGA